MNEHLDERKLNLIKVKVIELEKDKVIRKHANDEPSEAIRKYIERLVDRK